MKTILCCFAARRYWTDKKELENAFKLIVEKTSGFCDEAYLVDDGFDLSALKDNESNILIALPLSGAVQPNIIKAAGSFGSVLLLAGYVKDTFDNGVSQKMLVNNAAPAVMDVYAVLKREGAKVHLCTSLDGLVKRVNAALTVEKLKTARLLAIGQTEPWVISSVRDWSSVKERFGIDVVNVDQSELAELYQELKADGAESGAEWYEGAESTVEPTRADVSDATVFQAALIKLLEKYNANGAALACFNLLKTGTTSCLGVSYANTYTDYVVSCEGDMDSAITMLIMKLLSGDNVWMANPNIQNDGTVNFVHCTAPVVINGEKRKYILRNHHESGIGVSTQVELPENVNMTACRISNNVSQITIQGCVGIPTEYEPSCRTQLRVRFEDFDKYIRTALGCHQIFVFDDIKEELSYVADALGLEIL